VEFNEVSSKNAKLQVDEGARGERSPNENLREMLIFAARLAAWLVLAMIVTMTLSPPVLRPTTAIAHEAEHVVIFAAAGLAFGIGYVRWPWFLYISTVSFCAILEVAQLFVTGRHARLSDLVLNTIAATVGILAGSIFSKNWPFRFEKPNG
jgi:VanZ like family